MPPEYGHTTDLNLRKNMELQIGKCDISNAIKVNWNFFGFKINSHKLNDG